MKHILFRLLAILVACTAVPAAQAQDPPNILWITVEDMSPNLGSYGDTQAHTPNLDAFAREGVRFARAFATAPVCAPARSTIITGMYATSLGTHHMRSVGWLPDAVRPFTHYLRAAGYYTTNNHKEDYNFETPPGTWDASSTEAHWRNRPDPDQPFFAVFNLFTTHESHVRAGPAYERDVADLPPALLKDPDTLTLPPYHPDVPAVRAAWARYYNVITKMDREVAALLDQLEDDGLADETIVFYFADHGVGLPRGKRWLYDSGLHVPLIVRIPERYRTAGQGTPGTVEEALVSFVDLAPTVLNLAGVDVPEHMQGRAFLGPDLTPPRRYVYAARDRMDERYDMQRAVRDERFKYIRYYEPFKPFYQYMNTPEQGVVMKALRQGAAEGTLPPAAERLMTPTKPREELFDTEADPFETHNLADEPAYRDVLERMRAAQNRWVEETKDVGLIPEPILRAMEEEADLPAYTLVRQQEVPFARMRDVALLWTEGPAAVPTLVEALQSAHAPVRYWAAVSLGNLGAKAHPASGPLTDALADPSPTVAIAAARALCRMDQPDEALPVLVQHLRGDRQWVRLHAALVLDEIDDQARPAIDAMKAEMTYRDDMLADGKYTVRVLNRALNELLGTDNEVR
ncbi:MAG: DUF229 domain-containing protein [Bacteroidetes bacterium]|nr:MAG: DUF229 domain-containing protein [Bacteroidota bacterium]